MGLRTVIEGMPRETDLGGIKAPIALDGFFLRFWGSKDDHPSLPQSFALMGSDCSKDQVTQIRSTSYSGESQSATAKYRLTDCENVPFGINAEITTTERRPDVPTATQVTVRLDQNFEPRVTSNIKSTTLTLPEGLELGAQIASGEPLESCSDAQFAWDSTAPVQCPAGSRIADIEIVSRCRRTRSRAPATSASRPRPASCPACSSSASSTRRRRTARQAPRPALRRRARPTEDHHHRHPAGALRALHPHLPRRRPRPDADARQCGTTNGEITTVPSNGTGPVVQQLPLTIDEDCIDPAKFEPTMAITTTNPQAGARGVTRVQVVRPDRQARISKLLVNLPQGILSDLKLATECSAADAAAGTCPASSRIGSLTAESGVGPKPYAVKGDVYLRTRDEGAVAGLLISAPVKFGPVDLGRLNLPRASSCAPATLACGSTPTSPRASRACR